MKSLKVLSASLLIGTAVFGLSSCSSAQKGAASGGLIGGVVGASVGNATTAAPATGAVVGGATGAAVGGVAGDAYDQVTQADRERELENLQAQLWEAEEELAALKEAGSNPEAEQELANAKAEIDSLTAALEAAQAEAQQVALTRSAVDGELMDANSRIAELEAALTQQENALETMESDFQARLSEKESAVAARENEIANLQSELDAKKAQLAELDGEVAVLRTSLSGTEEQLNTMSSELEALNVQLEETSRGLTLTIVDSLLYLPGEAELSADGEALVGEVASIIRNNFPDRELLIEGHTDNQPIVHSGWRSNWELGAARALTLLHELVNSHEVDPAKVSATSMGEFRPEATNETPEGRRQNRRAVIVILPKELPIQRESLAQAN